jgi:hypothetical protein
VAKKNADLWSGVTDHCQCQPLHFLMNNVQWRLCWTSLPHWNGSPLPIDLFSVHCASNEHKFWLAWCSQRATCDFVSGLWLCVVDEPKAPAWVYIKVISELISGDLPGCCVQCSYFFSFFL